jgi:hypothetical protein
MHIKRVSRQVTSREPEAAIEKRKKIAEASPMVAVGSSRKNEVQSTTRKAGGLINSASHRPKTISDGEKKKLSFVGAKQTF